MIDKTIKKKTRAPLYLALAITAISAIVTLQDYSLGPRTFGGLDIQFTHYNNYKIFSESYLHLIDNKDLYKFHLEDHWDQYKYSPSFALLMAPFAYLPDAIGLFIWNWINGLIVFFALWKLPFKSDRIRLYAIGFVLLELITSLQNEQSNALIAGLIIIAYLLLERNQTIWAALLIVLTVYIKLFGVVAFVLFLFYPNKIKSGLYSIGWIVIVAALPLLVISPSQLSFLYNSWFQLLANDYSNSIGLSVVGWLNTWFGAQPPRLAVLLVGAAIFCVPLIKYKYYHNLKFRLLYLSSLLIWVVIFNHRAESPTYVLAIAGVAIWYYSQERKTENMVLLALAFILTVLSQTDLFPRTLRETYTIPYVLKAVPCILIWVKISIDLMLFNNKKSSSIVKEKA